MRILLAASALFGVLLTVSGARAEVLPPASGAGPTGPMYWFENRGDFYWANSGDHTIYTDYAIFPGRGEATLRLDYHLNCPTYDMNKFPGLVAEVTYRGIVRRVELLRFRLYQDAYTGNDDAFRRAVQLGTYVSGEPIRIRWRTADPELACTMQGLRAYVETASFATGAPEDPATAAARHAPIFGVRGNQCANGRTDIPLQVRYSVDPIEDRPGELWIKYEVFFSDEDYDGMASTSIGERLAIYGRRGDTAMFYKVHVDAYGNRIEAYYSSYKYYVEAQAPFYSGYWYIDHDEYPFEGSFLDGSDHPVLSVIADNNVLGRWWELSYCDGWFVAHQPVPYPLNTDPRDLIYFTEDPWMHWVSEGEQYYERGGLGSRSYDYLYMSFIADHGTVSSLHPFAEAQLPVDANWHSDWDMQNGRIAGLGIGKVNIDAIPTRTGQGSIYWKEKNFWQRFELVDFKPTEERYFRLNLVEGTYVADEIPGTFFSKDPNTGVITWTWWGAGSGAGGGGVLGGGGGGPWGADCGNGVCDSRGGESYNTCPEDCEEGTYAE